MAEPIPGYRIHERIGAGGYGEVWKADAPGGIAKAIKVVYGYHDDQRATRELTALNRIKQVRHPFLLSLERIELVDGHLVIVTELATSSLKNLFEQYRQSGLPGIPRDELLTLLGDAADALDYISEEHSLQHLDVKPENLLLVGGRIKVADFGLVKDLQDVNCSIIGGTDAGLRRPRAVRRPSQHPQRPIQPGDRLPGDAHGGAALRRPHHGPTGGPAPAQPSALGPLAVFRPGDDCPGPLERPAAAVPKLPRHDR